MEMSGSHDEFLPYITFFSLDLSCPSHHPQFSNEAKGLIIMDMTGSHDEFIIYIIFFSPIFHALAVGAYNGNDYDLHNNQVNTRKVLCMINIFRSISSVFALGFFWFATNIVFGISSFQSNRKRSLGLENVDCGQRWTISNTFS